MNNIYGALGLTSVLLLIIGYVVFFRSRTETERIMTQAMIHHNYSVRKKHIEKLNKKSQSKIRQEKQNVKVIVVQNEAYWIQDNAFYKAPLINHLISQSDAEQVDTSHMDKVQLDQMLFILDKLREGINDDSRGSGNA
jgi:hypothetical protein